MQLQNSILHAIQLIETVTEAKPDISQLQHQAHYSLVQLS